MTPIEKIRAEVFAIETQHRQLDGYFPPTCLCMEDWPCPILTPNLDKLKLAEALATMICDCHGGHDPDFPCSLTRAERALNEVSR